MSLLSITRSATVAALLVCSLASAQSSDQLPGFDLERLDINPGHGTLLVGNGELLVPGGLSVNLLGHYQRLPLVLNDGERDLGIVGNRATAVLSAAYGVLPWLEVSAQLPFVLWQHGEDPSTVGLSPLAEQGLGTPTVQARLGLLSRRQRKPVDLAADLGVGLPIGSTLALAADTGPRFYGRVVMGTTIGWVQPSLEAGVLFRPAILLASSQGDKLPRGASSEVRLAAALSTTGKGLRGELDLRAILASPSSMEVLGGVRFPLLTGLQAFVLGGPGVGRAPGTPLLRVLMGVSFQSEPPPRISYLDEREDQELQLVMATPAQAVADEAPVRPTADYEMRMSRGVQGALAAEGAPQLTPRPYQPGPGEQIVLRGDLPFSRGSAELPGVVSLLDQAVVRLAEQAQAGTILIQGYSDSEGKDSSDIVMSLRRAQAVRLYLIAQGVPAGRIRLRALGADWPVSPRPLTEQEHQLNRRAEVMVITDVSAPLPPQAHDTP